MRRLAVCVAAGAALILATPSWGQGVYTVDSCVTASGAAASSDGWSFSRSGSPSRSCPSPGITANEPRVVTGQLGGFSAAFTVPAPLRIIGYRLWRSVAVAPNWNYTLLEQSSGWPGATIEICWSFNQCSALTGRQTNAAPDITRVGVDLASVTLWVDCNPGPCPGSGQSHVTAHRLQAELRDPSAPTLTAAPSGDLVDTMRPISGVRTISFTAADQGSGVYLAHVEVDGIALASAVVDGNGGRCAKPFLYLVPCRATASGSVSMDTARLPDGPHTVRLVVTDATETNSVASGPVQVTTANRPVACSPGAATNLSLRFATTRRTALTRRGGRALSVTGTLEGATPGTAITLLTREVRSGAPRIAVATTVTGEGGAFRVGVPAGTSRTIRVGYLPLPDWRLLRCSKSLRLRVPARATFTARRTSARRFRLSGRLLGGSVPVRGKVVELQGYEGGRWREFRTIRSNAAGRFSTAYRFKAASSGRRFRVRVRVRTDPSYPFSTGYSRVVRLRVR